ncbi:MAG: 30S ribosomal protein S12 methylthiotransferase RimO [Bacteroidaceae bacterium]|nr:30S ribosomal protein S12 methylthiotransferase RimO [Bacteroidaceae bacterium]MBR6819842.1 30S ribosomal protein S12 methylthiotransferase RimO [Bacteroidaceae bacterium]MBR7051966.1 30S ribosomal protein S12 methylthiotransferase RimO [Bacteroidaceae bacterium]
MSTRCSIDILTLGCSKNLVDSERLIRQLEVEGYDVQHDPENPSGDIAIINTCGFIGDAKEESINVILEQAERKKTGSLKQLYVMGCLSQRYLSDLQAEIPEVDRFYGKFDWDGIVKDLGRPLHQDLLFQRRVTTPSHYAYLKIAEGCNRHCSYCAIPIITGQYVSRPLEEIVDEVRYLVSQGVKEFQVIAQELTYYGLDLYGERRLAQLVESIADIDGVEWIRLHYAYPTDFPMDLLPVMKNNPKVCRYLDIALQHIADPVLDMMHRHITGEETRRLIKKIREEVPGIHIRTTMMVGHPGETEEAFEALLDFVREMRFERLGAFAYSEEDGTWSERHYKDDIPEDVKQARLSKLMRIQQCISSEIQEEKVGKVMRVIIDRREGDYWIGRTEFDSPDVDPEVLISVSTAPEVKIGNFYEVNIISADDFDLYATL